MSVKWSVRKGRRATHATHEAAPDPPSVTLRNLTARRLGIRPRADGGVDLVIPPFGERTLEEQELDGYRYEEWRAHRLVEVDRRQGEAVSPAPAPPNRAVRAVCGATALSTAVFGLLWVLTADGSWALLALGTTVLTLVVASRTGSEEVRNRVFDSWGIVGVTVIAVGLSLWANEYYWPSRDSGDEVLLVLMASVGAGLPGALYFLFQRQRLPTLRETFVRDVVRLDPNVQTTRDAENAYGPLVVEAYGSGSGGVAGKLPIFLTTLLLAGFWVWAFGDPEQGTARLAPRAEVVTFAFLGAYAFAVNMVFRRYTRADLTPKAYTHIMVRTLVAVVSMWAISELPALQGNGTARSTLFLLAFLVGVLPETGTAIVQDFLQKNFVLGRIPSVREPHPLSKLNGISLYDAAHLLEAGIENVESLAHHRMVDLMLWTRIPTSRLVDLVDQAILYLHLRGPVDLDAGAASLPENEDGQGGRKRRGVEDPEDGARMHLCRHGIRTATDLERAVARAAERSHTERRRVLALLGRPSDVSRLGVVLDAMEDDEWLAYVRNWRETSSAGPVVRSVKEFTDLAVRRAALPESRGPAVRTVGLPAEATNGTTNGRTTNGTATGWRRTVAMRAS